MVLLSYHLRPGFGVGIDVPILHGKSVGLVGTFDVCLVVFAIVTSPRIRICAGLLSHSPATQRSGSANKSDRRRLSIHDFRAQSASGGDTLRSHDQSPPASCRSLSCNLTA